MSELKVTEIDERDKAHMLTLGDCRPTWLSPAYTRAVERFESLALENARLKAMYVEWEQKWERASEHTKSTQNENARLRAENAKQGAELGAICVAATVRPEEDFCAVYGAATDAVHSILSERNSWVRQASDLPKDRQVFVPKAT